MPPFLSQPSPSFRSHRALEGAFAEGAAIPQGGTIAVALPIFGSSVVRVRFEADVAGTLAATYLRPVPDESHPEGVFYDGESTPDAAVKVGSGNPTSVAVAADTETVLDIQPNGEAYVLLEFTEEGTAAGTVTSANAAQV